ncbi:hypothetical protein ACFOYW_05580 [Gryllotalpicola reticulitermitis]|uniref:DUF4760 domain-containing protein n=1 Tax=Gryllotalpicola reticulitermitis TaxID=1184153 RepID=A0ABV8Q3H5_9MICO
MQLWNDFVNWISSSRNEPVVFATAILLVGIIIAGLLAAWIARGTVRGMLERSDRQQKAAAIAALVDAATEASVWNSLTPGEQILSDRAVGQADILVRLLPVKGAGIAASWASHQLVDMKRNSATFGYQLDPVVAEFRDRLIEWQNRPGSAKRIFAGDLERWSFEARTPTGEVETQQDKWVAEQHHEKHAAPAVPPSAPVPQLETVSMDLPQAPQYLHDQAAQSADAEAAREPERYTA